VPGIFGYFDPEHLLANDSLEKMASAFAAYGGDFDIALDVGEIGGFGIVNYRGSPLITVGSAGRRYAVLGQLDTVEGIAKTSHDEVALLCFGGEQLADLSQLRGSFLTVVHYPSTQTLKIASDHFGSLPMYLYRYRSALIFASQIKAILAVLPERPQINMESVATMLSIGEVIGNRTLVSCIETLPAASCLTIKPAGESVERYWEYRYEEDVSISWDKAVNSTGSALAKAVARCTVGKASPAVPLSGGLDSRFVLDLACRGGAKPCAYTWGISGCRDLSYAQDVAARLGVPHDRFFFESDYLARTSDLGVWLTEGHIPATNFHVLPYVGELASRGHDVLLDGFAGDGVMGGNFISDAWLNGNDVTNSAEAIWQWRRTGFDGNWPHSCIESFHAIGGSIFRQTYLEYAGTSSMDKAMAFLIDNRVRRITTCGTELFRSRIPVRQPFMDIDVIDTLRVVPHAWRKRHRFYFEVMRRHAHVSARAPYQRTMLPVTMPYWITWFSLAGQRGVAEVFSRLGLGDPFPGKSPSDFAGWMRGALRNYVEGILLDERTLDRGVVPADLIRQAVDVHMMQGRNLSSLIGAMLTIELFCRLFLDDVASSISKFREYEMERVGNRP
jgi:asparagine synthase (glutamine-hydrolysing)